VTCEPPCEVTCPVGGTPEGETCGDATNDGCNVDPNAFGAIACEEIICGNVYADASLRDTDWYEFTLTEAQTVTLTVQGEIPMAALIVSGDCSAPVVEAGEVGDTCEVFSASAVLPAGTYYAFVAPSVYYGYPCATGPWDYTAELTCDELAVPATGPFGLGLLLLAISGILGFRIRRKK